MSAVAQALDGVKIVEFGGYAAGPHIGKILANYGATVVHVESRERPDGFRLQYPPFKDGMPGIDRGGCFAFFNDSKYGITLNLKRSAGVTLARRLVAWGDVVIENMRPGVMARLGLGYESLRTGHSDLIMLSTCNMGQTGPRADTPGFGSQLTALAGFCGLTGEPDGSPMLLYGPYIDFIGSALGTVAVLAALDRRHRTGCGSYIDLSQYECGLTFLAGALLDYEISGHVAERAGNRDPDAAPHGAYLCRAGRWLALSCWSDAEFAALMRAIGRPALAADPRFAGLAARQDHRAALDAALAAWCWTQDADEAAILLQHAGVAVHPVNTISDLFDDLQLRHRRTWRTRRHPVIGDQAYHFPGFELSRTPGDVTAPAPLLGADNATVFQQFLKLDAAELEALRREDAID
ncbi:MAG: CoA transferase [Alphaproteobacteria bacterium]|nr:CoA transferase [Alphaproteobacteria bacterium]